MEFLVRIITLNGKCILKQISEQVQCLSFVNKFSACR